MLVIPLQHVYGLKLPGNYFPEGLLVIFFLKLWHMLQTICCNFIEFQDRN